MPTYLFVLGHTPKLSLAELKAVAPELSFEPWTDHLAAVDLEHDQQAQQLQSILGGVFKVLKIIKPLPSSQTQQHLSIITDYLQSQADKVLFGLTYLPNQSEQLSPGQVKNKLQQADVKARYRRADRWGLSTAILSHQTDVFDMFVITANGQQYLAQTAAFQDLEDWVERDRGKPYTPGKKGMVPPKLARILVNLGLGQLKPDSEQSPILYDPFCGSGTILMEALLRGCHVVGSDLDPDAVAGCLQNLYWFEQEYNLPVKYQVFQSDAAHIDQFQWEEQPDLIVTEPFLGKPNPKPNQLKNIFTGLESIYLGAFKTWTQVLKNEAKIVIIFPQVKTKNHTYDLLHLIDKIESYGYTLEVKPIDYGYQDATVKRQILVFTYQANT